MRVDLPEVPLLPAHFLWYVPFDSIEEKRVRMGVRMEEKRVASSSNPSCRDPRRR